MSAPVRILYTHGASLIGGGNKVLLNLFQKIDRGRYEPISVIPERGPLEAELRELGVPYIVLDVRPSVGGRFETARIAASLALTNFRKRIRLIHANDPLTYRIASVAAALTRIPKLCHLHHPDQNPDSIAWAFARRPRLVLTPTHYVKEKVCEWLGLCDAPFVQVVGNPIDTEWFSPAGHVGEIRKKLNFSLKGPHITIIGAIAPHKGHECFLRAAALVLRQHQGAQFHIVGSAKSGDQAWGERLRSLSAEFGIGDAVRFWGFAPDDVTRNILRASDLFMLPTKLEGFGLVIAEALSCGVPVLTSAIRPLDEIVSDGKSGFLIRQDDHEQFAGRAMELLASAEMRRSFAEYGRGSVKEAYSIDAVVMRIMTRYESILMSPV